MEASTSGESLDNFVIRIAPKALEVSKAARATICGQIDGEEGHYTIQMKTDGYISDCSLPKSGRPYVLVNGMATEAREGHFSQENWKRPGYLVTPWTVKYQDGSSKRPRVLL